MLEKQLHTIFLQVVGLMLIVGQIYLEIRNLLGGGLK